MAEDQGQEKTEQKSHKKWEEARDKGDLPKSQEFATFVVFTVIIIYFMLMRTRWFDEMGAIMIDLLRFDQHLGLDQETLGRFLLDPTLRAAKFLAPFFLIVLVVSMLVNMSQTGFQLASKKLQIDWNRLDPVKGIKNKVSIKAAMEGLKSALKIGLFAFLAFWTISEMLPDLIELPAHDLRHQLRFLVSAGLKLAIRLAILMAFMSIGDFAFQWWRFQEQLKMTPREVKDEMKEQEGDPLIRQRLRNLRMEMSRNRMMEAVPDADVVVTNPTHYAVAISYDVTKAPAPYVSAKGRQYMALKIRAIAAEHGIPIIENPPMARALFKHVKVGEAIPSEFYRAIAELLAFVFLLKKRPRGLTRDPADPYRPKLKTALPDKRTSPKA